jgi:hypothetical protein
MEGIITLILVILMIVARVIKAVKETAGIVKQPPPPEEELVIITRPKPVKKSKASMQRTLVRQPLEDTLDISVQPKRQALSQKLNPQGEGQRFDADPGTLDTERIVAPKIDPSVKPELESITGIYEEGAVFADRSRPAITLNIADFLAKPEGIIQAVIFAEVLNQPAWQKIS